LSLLDTFSLLFETDAGEAADDVGRLSDELDGAGDAGGAAAAGVDESSQAAQRGAESFNSMAKTVGGLVAAYLSFGAVSAAVFGQALATDQVGKFSETVGLSIETVDAWGAAVALNGGSADSFRGSIQSLNSAMSDIALGGGGDIAEVLGRLGVSALDSSGRIKSVTDLLPQLADSFQNLSNRESVAFGEKLGLDQGTILLLQQGRGAVEAIVEQQRQLGGRTKEGYEASAKFNDTLNDTKRVFVGMSDTANQALLPVLTKILEGFQTITIWAREHEDVVKGFFIGVAGAIAAFYLPTIFAAAAATLVAAAPFLLIAATVAAVGIAFGLLYEDVKAYIGGQESFVGSLGDKYEWFGKLLDAVIAGAKFLFRELSEFAQEMFGNLGNGLEIVGGIFEAIFSGIGNLFGVFGLDAGTATENVISAFRVLGKIIGEVLGFIASPIETTKELFDSLFTWIGGLLEDFGIDSAAVTKEVAAAFQVLGDIIDKIFGFIASPIESTKELIDDLVESIPDMSELFDDAVGGVKDFFSFDSNDDEINGSESNTKRMNDQGPGTSSFAQLINQSQQAMAASETANANPMLSGAGGAGSRTSFVSQSNSFSTTVDARGQTPEQARAIYGDEMSRSVATAKGQLDDGVAY
jgi:hypothetical protein